MSLRAKITEDMKSAMRAKESQRLGTIRLLQAAIKQKEVDERVELDDAAIVAIVDKLVKPSHRPIARTWSIRSKSSWTSCNTICRNACPKPKWPLPWRRSLPPWEPAAPATWAK